LKESPDDHTFLSKMTERYLIVSVCRGSGTLAKDTVSIGSDNRKGTFAALNYLCQLGHRRIGFVDGSRLADIGERKKAYLEFVTSRFGEANNACVQPDENTYRGGYRATKRLLSLPESPTAIFASDDAMAVGVLKAAAEMGYQVPRDLSVIGYDDIKIAAYLQPSLTTVRQPIEGLGRRAVELMLDMVEAKSVPSDMPHVAMEPELIVRDSCAPPSRPRDGTAA